MTSIVKYKKVIADGTTYIIAEPDYAAGADRCTELATIDGVTYVAVPAWVTLPAQPKKITIGKVTLTDAMRSKIKQASPHVALINARVVAKIREKYSINDELKILRIGTRVEFDAYNALISDYVAAGRAEKAKLGL